MAEVRPFRGIYYAMPGSLDQVVAPPYDVISPAEQDALYAADAANVIRVIMNRAEPDDIADSDPHERAAACLAGWLADGTLVEDAEPALYLYRQRFRDPRDRAEMTRTSLLCALALEPYDAGVVLPHEETRPRARADRLSLMRATAANTEPILLLYEDPWNEVGRVLSGAAEGAPMLQASVQGDDHLVWRIGAPETADALSVLFADRRLWIADGHHRYETALTYARERDAEEATAPDAPWRYMMVALTAFEDAGLLVLPTHRLVQGVDPQRVSGLRQALRKCCSVEDLAPAEMLGRLAAPAGEGAIRFGCVTAEWGGIAELTGPEAMRAAAPGRGEAWRALDVAAVQELVLGQALGLTPEMVAAGTAVTYTRDAQDAIRAVREGLAQAAFLLGQPPADAVRGVAAEGDRMPPKSTFFYPKLWSGLLMRRLDRRL